MEKHSEVIDFNIQVMLGAVLRHRALPSALRGFCVSADSNRETLCETAKQGMSERVCVCVCEERRGLLSPSTSLPSVLID